MSSKQEKDSIKNPKSGADQLNARRKAVRAIVIGGGAVTGAKSLPSEWKAPIVNAVVLPGHATTTDDTGSAAGGGAAPTPAPTEAPTTTPTATTTLCAPGYYYSSNTCYYDGGSSSY